MFVLISYDITDNRRRLKLAELLLDFGAERVQYSVFECFITQQNLVTLTRRIEGLIEETEDSVRIYALCENCRAKPVMLGKAEQIAPPGLLIL